MSERARGLEYASVERKRRSPEVQNVRRHQPEDDRRFGHWGVPSERVVDRPAYRSREGRRR